jgi:hypothetical protein
MREIFTVSLPLASGRGGGTFILQFQLPWPELTSHSRLASAKRLHWDFETPSNFWTIVESIELNSFEDFSRLVDSMEMNPLIL